ncbi:MAG: hypothetical protein ACOC0D_11025, partial [Spirochaeta sp.]
YSSENLAIEGGITVTEGAKLLLDLHIDNTWTVHSIPNVFGTILDESTQPIFLVDSEYSFIEFYSDSSLINIIGYGGGGYGSWQAQIPEYGEFTDLYMVIMVDGISYRSGNLGPVSWTEADAPHMLEVVVNDTWTEVLQEPVNPIN